MTSADRSAPSTPGQSPGPLRLPIWWLVIGGPLVVVVAALVTGYIAMSNADEVLSTRPPAVSATSDAESRALAPAVQGRNHAVSPNMPGAASAPR